MMSKKEYDRKRREEQEAAAHVFQEFINTFQNASPAPNKTFVKSGILYSEDNQETKEARQLYIPKPVIRQNNTCSIKSAIECARLLKESNLDKPKKHEKPKSNLDLLKEELKLRHTERGERERLKEELDLSTPALSYFEGGDPNSTNLFVANLSSKVTENHLMLEFGAYGPLASVKIMWPRGDDKTRNSNCGFVAFMSRKDAERALKANKNREDMRVGWGKSVELPAHPIYIPNSLLKLYLPPALSGLPFNAQPPSPHYKRNCSDKEFNDFLYNCVVKVTIPLNKKILMLVHRMVEFVVREGPMFEAFIMNKELGNPEFNFLFDYQNPIHVYYRWKLYSILVGDNKKSWSMKPFRMFKGGSVWLPPIAPNYTEGMPEELVNAKDKAVDETKLSEGQCNRLITLLRGLTMNRSKIAEAMMFCLNHNLALKDSLEIILDSMRNTDTCPLKKIARLYLLSDVLFNAKQANVNLEDDDMNLMEVFKVFHSNLTTMRTACDKDNFKSRVLRVLHHWDVCRIVSPGVIRKSESLFLNNTETLEPADDDNSDIDEPLDGANLIRRSLKNDIGPEVVTTPINPNEKKTLNKKQIMEYFVPSKWDTVDPQEVEAQAMSTEKMYYMELEAKLNASLEEEKRGIIDKKATESTQGRSKWKGKGKRKKSKDREGRYGSDCKRSRSRSRKK